MATASGPGIVVEPSGLYPPLSGIGYYARELLRAYAGLPGHFPLTILSPRFFLARRPAPGGAYLHGLARELDAEVEVEPRLLPSLFYRETRRFGLRPPVPLDLAVPPANRLFFFPNYVGAPLLARRAVPVIYDFGFLRFPRTLRGRDDLYLRRYLPATLRHALHVVVISDSVKRELESAYGLAPDRVTTVYPAVDHARFRPDVPEAARRAARKKYGLEGRYVFSLGTLEPRKNFTRLVEAFGLLDPAVRSGLVLAIGGGPGWKSADVPAAIARLGLGSSVKLLGYVDDEDRGPLLASASLFALPSLYEGFGLPVLEAMACGTPVVTSARGALAELAGDAAAYVDPLRPESIAAGLDSLLRDATERARLSSSGLRRSRDFDWGTSARVLAGVFERAAEEARLTDRR